MCRLRVSELTTPRTSRGTPRLLTIPNALKTEEDHVAQLTSDLAAGHKRVMIAQVAPAVRVSLGEEFGLPVGTPVQGKAISALRALGFDYVFDVAAGADLTILEEGSELLHRIVDNLEGKPDARPLPMFSSCCPGWVDFVEKSSSDLIPYVSSCKSPHMMQGAVIKTFFSDVLARPEEDLVVTSVMPCVRKQGEADRDLETSRTESGHRHVDHVVTTKGLASMIKAAGIDFESLPDGHFDAFMGYGTGGGLLFGSTGGVLEAALRTVYEVAAKGSDRPTLDRVEFTAVRGLDGLREAVVTIPRNPTGILHNEEPFEIRVAVCSGLASAKALIKDMIAAGNDATEAETTAPPKYHFVEVMACPGGCIGGGGQPRSKDKDALKKRQQALYSLDAGAEIRSSHFNPVVQNLYDKYLIKPGSEEAEKLLHTRLEAGGAKRIGEGNESP